MTAKEKAQELVDKFRTEILSFLGDRIKDQNAKRCALIAVDKKIMIDNNLQRKAYDLYTDAKEVIDNLIEKIDNLEADITVLEKELEQMADRIIELEDYIINILLIYKKKEC